ncbi:MAG: hypothetical protein ACK58T_30925 [Phycisphaerae bacterium]
MNIDESWKGGDLIVPFEGQHASSVEFGQLADSADISKYNYVRGSITTQPEAWASLVFAHKDLMQHDGKIPESTFLRILPGQVDGMLTYFKMVMSVHLLGGSHFATATADGTAGGILAVDRIDRFALSQKLVIDDGNSSPQTCYVIAINVDAKQITVSATRGGAALDISAYTLAQTTRCFHPGAQAEPFTSLKSQLLSAANGGSAALFGQTKTAFPFLQCPNISGADVTATNILDKIFDAYVARMSLGKGGKAPEVMMSFKHFGSILKLLEVSKGPFNVAPNSRKTSPYGWAEIEVGSVGGQMLKLVGVQECDDDVIYFLDWDSVTFYSNGMFKRRRAPDGKEYFETRATTGYLYILDHCLHGDLVCTAPWKNAILHSIPNY